MPSRTRRPDPADFEVIPFRRNHAAAGPAWVVCDRCYVQLELSQPAIEMPERLIGVCAGCRTWFLIIIGPREDDVLMVMLPESQALRDAWDGRKERPRSEEAPVPEGDVAPPVAAVIPIRDDRGRH